MKFGRELAKCFLFLWYRKDLLANKFPYLRNSSTANLSGSYGSKNNPNTVFGSRHATDAKTEEKGKNPSFPEQILIILYVLKSRNWSFVKRKQILQIVLLITGKLLRVQISIISSYESFWTILHLVTSLFTVSFAWRL